MESERSGMRKEKNVEEIKIQVQYKTPEYIAVKEAGSAGTGSMKERINKLKGTNQTKSKVN